jgi:hypothetical protein
MVMLSVVYPEEMPVQEREYLERHLYYSSALKEMWCRGDAILEGIYNRKRSLTHKRRVIKDAFIRRIIYAIRRFMKYELLRSSLEGLMFEQVTFLNEPHERRFRIEGVSNELKMTHVYFSRQFWDFNTFEKESILDKGEELTEDDIAFIMCYFMKQDELLEEIRQFTMRYTGQDRLGWKARIMRNIRNIRRIQEPIKTHLMTCLEDIIRQDESG